MLAGRDEVVEGVEGVEEGVGGGGGDDPVRGCVFDVVGGDILADGDAVPAEAVDEVGGHGGDRRGGGASVLNGLERGLWRLWSLVRAESWCGRACLVEEIHAGSRGGRRRHGRCPRKL